MHANNPVSPLDPYLEFEAVELEKGGGGGQQVQPKIRHFQWRLVPFKIDGW